MFNIILIVLLGIGAFFLLKGFGQRQRGRIVLGALIVVLSLLLFWFMDFWGEKLWFDALGYNDRFWTLFFFRVGLAAGGALLGIIIVLVLLAFLPRNRKLLRWGALALSAFIGAGWGLGNWSILMKFWYGVKTGVTDPILGMDTGFYLFSLPFFEKVYGVLVTVAIICVAVSVLGRFRLERSGNNFRLHRDDAVDKAKMNNSLYFTGGVLLLILAAGKFLDRYELLYSDLGAVSGPGWTDVNIILPSLMVMVVITALLGILLLLPPGRSLLQRFIGKSVPLRMRAIYTAAVAGVIVLASWFVGLTLIPMAFQNWRVEPNEISYEKPFIENNIQFTRQAFKLDVIEDREFPATDEFNREMVQKNQAIFDNIRLWDYRALDAVLKQFQEIRLYYEFADVDIDRYRYNDDYRQVMVSAREMNANNLPQKSQTFVNQIFKYTHGFGIALTTVSDFTPEGLPNLLVKNIPPESEYPELAVDQPRIYYGELTDDYVVSNSTEQEFDYPKGETNEYNSYDGTGGVQLSNFLRRFIYAYKMDDLKLLLSTYPTDESRIMFRRQVKERVENLAPFLELDSDPYIVNANGQLYWMIDAYTTSEYYPYAEPFSAQELLQYKEGESMRSFRVQHNREFAGINYIRNSVKAVVNAYDGSVEFYVFDDEDPLIKVWDKIFPGMMKPRAEMPDDLLNHIRYPVDYLLIQGLVYAKYHMGDPEVFYNQEDLWIRATEKYYGDVRPVEPYYIMWQRPEATDAEFSLILPFTPKNRQVSIGWIAGLCDPENYGRFLAYSFPKEKRVLGPQQVETKIDQDSYLSGQLSLWDQRGSRVIRGNVLAIPVENTIFYVEPIYLQAETAAYPELRLVCVMHDDQLSYAESFEEALAGLIGEERRRSEPDAEGEEATAAKPAQSTDGLIRQANRAFETYLNATGSGRFQEASQALDELQRSLEALQGEDRGVGVDTVGESGGEQ